MPRLILLLFLILVPYTQTHAAVNENTISEILSTIDNQYYQEINRPETILTGLTALSDIDSNLHITKGTERFYIYYHSTVVRVIPFPENDESLSAWRETLIKVFQAAIEISEPIAIKDFELPDLFTQKLLTKLDEYSHYYSPYDYVENERSNAFHTLFSERLIDNVLYLRVRIFNKQTAANIEKSLRDHPEISGVILDLRGNSGGILNAALKTANFFTDNEIITYTAEKDNRNIHYYTSEEGELYRGPLVILIDGQTASAAEVLAAGLQEQSRAKLIGTRSFGKGTIQKVTRIGNGGKLALTTAQFFTPSGKKIHRRGVIPDFCTVSDEQNICRKAERLDNDEDLNTAIKAIKNEL